MPTATAIKGILDHIDKTHRLKGKKITVWGK